MQKRMIIISQNDMIQDGIKHLIDMKGHLIDREESTEVLKDHEGKNSFYVDSCYSKPIKIVLELQGSVST